MVVLTSRDLSPEERLLLSRNVEKVLQKGAYGREALLQEVRRVVARYAGRAVQERKTADGGGTNQQSPPTDGQTTAGESCQRS